MSNPIRPPSEKIRKAKIKILGHVLRAPPDDPMKQVTIKSQCDILIPRKRIVGRPRMHWTNDTMTQAYGKLIEDHNFPYIPRHNNYITKQEGKQLYKLAQNRTQWKDKVVYQKDEHKRKYDKT